MAVVAFDVYTIVGIVLCIITFISYGRVTWHQFNHVKKFPSTFRMAILSLRAASVIPGFAICYWLSLFIPSIYAGMQFPEALLQAYCVLSFFSMIAFYVGGPTKCVEIFRTTTHTFPDCLFGCMNRTPERCYYHAYLAVWQFMLIRPIVVIGVIIAFYVNQNDLSLLLSALTTLQAAWGVGGLVKFYHVLYDFCKGLNMTKKIFVIKTIIGLVLFQAFLEEVLFYFGFLNVSSSGLQSFSAEDIAIRYYCFAVLVELVIFCVLVEKTFSYEMDSTKGKNFILNTTANSALSNSHNSRDIETSMDQQSQLDRPISPDTSSFVREMTLWQFLRYLVQVLDVFDGMKLGQLLENPGSGSSSASTSVDSIASIHTTMSMSHHNSSSNSPSRNSDSLSIAMVDFKSSV